MTDRWQRLSAIYPDALGRSAAERDAFLREACADDDMLRADVESFAVKVLPPDLTADPDRAARLAREARVLASLNHPHIASIYGFEDTRETTRPAGAHTTCGACEPTEPDVLSD
jgi:hypothetical protein